MQQVDEGDIRSRGQGIFIHAKARGVGEVGAMIESVRIQDCSCERRANLNWPMSWKMLAWLLLPAMGILVCKGFAGTNAAVSAPKGAGLVLARNGGTPVGVGPAGVSCLTRWR